MILNEIILTAPRLCFTIHQAASLLSFPSPFFTVSVCCWKLSWRNAALFSLWTLLRWFEHLMRRTLGSLPVCMNPQVNRGLLATWDLVKPRDSQRSSQKGPLEQVRNCLLRMPPPWFGLKDKWKGALHFYSSWTLLSRWDLKVVLCTPPILQQSCRCFLRHINCSCSLRVDQYSAPACIKWCSVIELDFLQSFHAGQEAWGYRMPKPVMLTCRRT